MDKSEQIRIAEHMADCIEKVLVKEMGVQVWIIGGEILPSLIKFTCSLSPNAKVNCLKTLESKLTLVTGGSAHAYGNDTVMYVEVERNETR